MKGCFLLQRRFAYIGHFIAQHLKESYGVDKFCGYTYLRSSYEFLKSQQDVTYTTLLSDEDIHARYEQEKLDPAYLDFLEKKFGIPFLWPFLAVDRVLMSNQLVREYPHDKSEYTHEEMLRILQVHARAIIRMLDEERPDFVFFSILGGVGSYLLYQIAKTYGIKTIFVLMTGLRDRYILSERYDSFTWADKKFMTEREALKASPAWKDAVAYIEHFRKQPGPYLDRSTPEMQSVTRLKQFKFLNPKNAVRSLRTFSRNVVTHFTGHERFDYSYVSPWNYLKDMAMRKLRNLIGADDLYDEFNPNENFAFFPLHLEPEVSLLLQAPNYTDQMNLIRQIARSLPVRFKLLVKEHPLMAEYRPRAFYKKLKNIPNVKLISPTISSYAITPMAKLIFTITGTIGWEGLMLKKPIITFGHWFYNSMPMVKFCREIETLPTLVKEQLDHYTHDEEELLAMTAAIFDDSAKVNLAYLWEEESDFGKKKEGVRPLADLLAKKLGLT